MKPNHIFLIIIASIFLVVGIIASEDSDYGFALSSTFIPALLFPLASIDIKGKHWLRISIHYFISIALLILLLSSYLLNDRTYYSIFFGGFFGSLLFQIATKYIFNTETSWKVILLVAALSLIAFIPFQMSWSYARLGFGIFVWMITNAFISKSSTTANTR